MTNPERTSHSKYRATNILIGTSILFLVLLANLLLEEGNTNVISRTAETGPARIQTASLLNQLADQKLRFVANLGQVGSEALFHVQGAGHTVLFLRDEIRLRRTESEIGSNEIVLQFEGANSSPIVDGLERLPGVAHFYRGSDPDKWQTDVPTYGAVYYTDLYPGIDMAYIGEGGVLESEFYIAPGADFRLIRMSYKNVGSQKIRSDGALVIDTILGELIEEAPVAYQEIDGARNFIEARYNLFADGTVGFELGSYDSAVPVVIDPELRFLKSFGSVGGGVWSSGVALDGAGNVIVAGAANRFFSTTDEIPGSNHAGGVSSDGLLIKLDGATGDVIFSVLFGGSNLDYFNDMAIDAAGTLYLTGLTGSNDFPLLNPAQDTRAGSEDAFLTILSADGVLMYSTYIGGTERDWGEGVAIDGTGNVFIAGITGSTDFPTVGGFQQQHGGGNASPTDFFVTRYNSDGTVGYSTYLGGAGDEHVCGLAVDASGEVTLAGRSSSTDYPLMNAFQTVFGGTPPSGTDIVVSRLNSAGDGLIYSSYFGGPQFDWCSDIELGTDGEAFVTGGTFSENFPVIGGISTPEALISDGVLLMLDNDGQPVYSVRSNFLGKDSFDALAIDADNTAVFVAQQGASIIIYSKTLTDPLAEIFSFDATEDHGVNSAFLAGNDMALTGTYFPAAGKGNSSGSTESEIWAGLVPNIRVTHDVLAQSQKRVEGIRKTFCPPENINSSWSFLSPVPLSSGDRITSNYNFSVDWTVPTPAYIGMIQCQPNLLYASPGALVLIDTEQPPGEPEALVIEIDGPIAINMEYKWNGYLERLESPDRQDPNGSTIVEIQDIETIHESDDTPATTPRVCVIMVMGKPDGEFEEKSFSNDQAMFKRNLISEKLGARVDPSDITELTSPSHDELVDAIKSKKDNCDIIYFMYSGHGHVGFLSLNGPERISYTELSRELYGTGAQEINVVLDACHSGSAIKRFQADDRFSERDVTVVTAAAADKVGYGTNQLDVDGEIGHWGLTFGYWLMRGYGNPDADTDGDGGTSIREAFEWMHNENPPVVKKSFLTEEVRMNERSNPQILTNETKKASDEVSFSDSDIKMLMSIFDPSADISVASVSGLNGSDRNESNVTEISAGRRWIIDGTAQMGGFNMDIVFAYDANLDFEILEGVIPGLVVRPHQEFTPGKNGPDLWQAYLPTVWDPDAQTITAIGVTVFQEWAIALTVGASAVSTESTQLLPVEFGLRQNYPNPFSSSTKISYKISEPGVVRITVFDLVGRAVKVLVEEEQTAGVHHVDWDGENENGIPVASGTFIVRLDINNRSDSMMLTLLK